MHFDWTISLGNLLTIVSALGVLLRVNNLFNLYGHEHDAMWVKFCKETGTDVNIFRRRLGDSLRSRGTSAGN